MNEADWIKNISAHLVGRRIVGFRYMTQREAEDCYWSHRAAVLELDDGSLLFPSADDEGNNAGALFSSNEAISTIPVMR